RALTAIVGVLSLLAGLVCVRRPGESLLALVIVLGFWLIIEGIVRFIRAFSELGDRALPDLSLVPLAVLFAISLLARGVFAIITAFKLRGLAHGKPGAAAA